MRKHSYTWPHRSRKAMIAYLAEHKSYWPMNSNNGGFVLAWNVKIHCFDEMGKSAPADSPVNDRFDGQWRRHINDSDIFWQACSDAASMYTEGEWTNYPGIEQGEWKFSMNGRSSGYMILTHAPSWCPAPRDWAAYPMIWSDSASYKEWLAELDTATLRQFYRAIRVLDHDLRREACQSEVSYHFAAYRHLWEQEQIATEDCRARKIEAARPDMYQA